MLARLILCAFVCLVSQRAPAFCPTEGDPGWEPDMYSVAREFKRAKYVVLVRSLKETWLDENGKPTWPTPPYRAGGRMPLGMDPYLGAIYELEVTEVFKGAPARRLKVFSSNTTARTPLPVGGEYLLFMGEHDGPDEAGLTLYIDNCGNSSDLPTARATLQAVRVLARKK